MNHPLRTAVTLVELLVVLGVIGLLVAIGLPAIQQVRESGRRTLCQDHLRQIGLAAGAYESTHGCFVPGGWFNGVPGGSTYSYDEGMFVRLAPWLELQAEADQYRQCVQGEDRPYPDAPPLLLCPSGEGSSRLKNLSRLANGAPVPGLDGGTCDYRGNTGYFHMEIRLSSRMGPVGVQIEGSSIPRVTGPWATDGRSHSILAWESLGSRIVRSRGERQVNWDIEDRMGDADYLLRVWTEAEERWLDFPPVAPGGGAAKKYLHAWVGIRTGWMQEMEGRVINDNNLNYGLYSLHAAGANVVMLDGSVRLLAADLDPAVGHALASIAGGETVNLEQ